VDPDPERPPPEEHRARLAGQRNGVGDAGLRRARALPALRGPRAGSAQDEHRHRDRPRDASHDRTPPRLPQAFHTLRASAGTLSSRPCFSAIVVRVLRVSRCRADLDVGVNVCPSLENAPRKVRVVVRHAVGVARASGSQVGARVVPGDAIRPLVEGIPTLEADLRGLMLR
jgi:hypothetical protein